MQQLLAPGGCLHNAVYAQMSRYNYDCTYVWLLCTVCCNVHATSTTHTHTVWVAFCGHGSAIWTIYHMTFSACVSIASRSGRNGARRWHGQMRFPISSVMMDMCIRSTWQGPMGLWSMHVLVLCICIPCLLIECMIHITRWMTCGWACLLHEVFSPKIFLLTLGSLMRWCHCRAGPGLSCFFCAGSVMPKLCPRGACVVFVCGVFGCVLFTMNSSILILFIHFTNKYRSKYL